MPRRPSAVVLLALVAALPALAGQPSKLWPPPTDPALRLRLADFSFAGYGRGERPIPTVKVVASVRDFGAKGDGVVDDTAAFKAAIERAPAGAIEVPPGRYLITEILDIKRPNLVLRGAGPAKTTLYFPKFLEDLRPNPGQTTSGRPTSNYSWSGGFVWVRGNYQSSELAKVTAPARLGDTKVTVSKADGIKVGQAVEIEQRDDAENSLAIHLYAGQADDVSKIKGSTRASLTARVTRVDGNVVHLDRPLRFDVEAKWGPRVLRFAPTVTEVGIEGVRFEFPVLPYEGHFTERGHNAIAFNQVADCWVRDVVIDESDSGIFATGRYCTFENVTWNSTRPVDKGLKCTGHHGFEFGGDDNLLTNFRFNTRFVHDLTVSRCAGNVVSDGGGVDLCFDHHKRTPYANLFTNLDLGQATRMYQCGGGDKLGRHSAADTVFWNVRGARPQAWPPRGFGPDRMVLVGVQTEQRSELNPTGKWFEAIPPADLTPQNIHTAQLANRLNAVRKGR